MGQTQSGGTEPGTESGTNTLKALADKVLERAERDKQRDRKWDKLKIPVPLSQRARDKNLVPRPVATDAPSGWVDGFARLASNPLPGFSNDRWLRVLRDGERFLVDWAAKAEALGWRDVDVFGCHPEAPGTNLELMGLVPLIGGRTIVAMTADRACIAMSPDRTALTFYRTPMKGATLLWLLGSA